MIFEYFAIALHSLTTRKLRSSLTILGVTIGIAAIIALTSIGRGVQLYVANQLSDLGSNILFVLPGQFNESLDYRLSAYAPLTLDNAEVIGDPAIIPEVAGMAAEYMSTVSISRGRASLDIRLRGVTPSYPEIRKWQPVIGTFFTQTDYDASRRVVVLGADTYAQLFEPGEYPLGQQVTINDVGFEVIGVMEAKGGSPQGNRDESGFIPLSTGQKRLWRKITVSGDYQLTMIHISVRSAEEMDTALAKIKDVLREQRNITYLNSDDFTVVSQNDVISVFDDVLSALTVFLGGIAAISLLIGGINIMNMMLVAVRERTTEIGLRKAIGASRSQIIWQFLLEAITLTLCGGILGILLGVAGAQGISIAIDDLQAVVQWDMILLAVAASMTVGLFFGTYPALRAGRMNPIDALRAR